MTGKIHEIVAAMNQWVKLPSACPRARTRLGKISLMKTQMTKNTLIVPVGSKGGFIVKLPFSGREEGAELSRQAYERLMRGLLDLTESTFEFRRVDYDVATAQAKILEAGLPAFLAERLSEGM